ncbi:hypothetical protein J437_LFUL018190, partial [Ladona fulva]
MENFSKSHQKLLHLFQQLKKSSPTLPHNFKQNSNLSHFKTNSSALKWTDHLKAALSKAYARSLTLAPLLNKRRPLSAPTKLRLIHSTIIPVILYGAPITFKTSKVNIKNIEKFYNNLIRQ